MTSETAARGPEPPARLAGAVVEAVGVGKSFGGVSALDGATVGFRPGEVHCLAGENGCGKSTLIKVISGTHRADTGHLVVSGTTYDHLSPRLALSLGIEVIYQDFSLLPNLSAAENIALPDMTARRVPLVRQHDVMSIAEAALAKTGITLDLRTPVGELTVADRQLCAVARALAHDSVFLAMDEPTTALTWREVDALFEAIDKARKQGVAIAFVSHKLQEVFSIADRVSIMRNGTIVSTGTPDQYTHESLTERMTGRSSRPIRRSSPTWEDRPPALSVRGLSLAPLFADIDLDIGQGEIVGLSGLLGSGRTEIAEALAGVNPASAGQISVRGAEVRLSSVPDAIRAGIGYVPEDRLTQGLFLDQPITDNLVAASLDAFARPGGLLDRRKLVAASREMITGLRIKLSSPRDPVRSLSGGNAQRVLLGKWLLGDPKVLILNGPTVGVDVGSKFDILAMLHAQSLRGLGILMISDDVPELVSTCDRVLVARSGRIAAELPGDALTEEALLAAVTA